MVGEADKSSKLKCPSHNAGKQGLQQHYKRTPLRACVSSKVHIDWETECFLPIEQENVVCGAQHKRERGGGRPGMILLPSFRYCEIIKYGTNHFEKVMQPYCKFAAFGMSAISSLPLVGVLTTLQAINWERQSSSDISTIRSVTPSWFKAAPPPVARQRTNLLHPNINSPYAYNLLHYNTPSPCLFKQPN